MNGFGAETRSELVGNPEFSGQLVGYELSRA
jgi:hypothetical protein